MYVYNFYTKLYSTTINRETISYTELRAMNKGELKYSAFKVVLSCFHVFHKVRVLL